MVRQAATCDGTHGLSLRSPFSPAQPGRAETRPFPRWRWRLALLLHSWSLFSGHGLDRFHRARVKEHLLQFINMMDPACRLPRAQEPTRPLPISSKQWQAMRFYPPPKQLAHYPLLILPRAPLRPWRRGCHSACTSPRAPSVRARESSTRSCGCLPLSPTPREYTLSRIPPEPTSVN